MAAAVALLLFLVRAAGRRVDASLEEAAFPRRAILPPLFAVASGAAAFAPEPERPQLARLSAAPPTRTRAQAYVAFWDGLGFGEFPRAPRAARRAARQGRRAAVSDVEAPAAARATRRVRRAIRNAVDAPMLEEILDSGEAMALVTLSPLPLDDGLLTPEKLAPLPEEWARKFHGASLSFVEFGFDKHRGKHQSLQGHMLGCPGEEVAIDMWRAHDAATARHFRINTMLADVPSVARVFERREFQNWTFALVEPPTHTTLSEVIRRHAAWWESLSAPQVPLSTALPLMIDLLASFKKINARGVVMSDIHRYSLGMSSDRSHIVLDDFRSAGVEFSTDPEVSCQAAALTTSPYRLAPEIRGHTADRVSNNQWQLGLLFAHMLLGAEPIEDLVYKMHGEVNAESEEGRRLIKRVVRHDFFVWEMDRFRKLAFEYADVLRIVSGLLEKDPVSRWTAEEARREAVKVAKARDIPIGGPRVPKPLPQEWRVK